MLEKIYETEEHTFYGDRLSEDIFSVTVWICESPCETFEVEANTYKDLLDWCKKFNSFEEELQ